MTIGEVVKQHRITTGKTQEMTAKEAGISRSYLASIESNQFNPSIKTLLKLAKTLNIDLKILNQMTEIQGSEINGSFGDIS